MKQQAALTIRWTEREERISFRVSGAQKKAFERLARTEGLDMSSYLRRIMLRELRKAAAA